LIEVRHQSNNLFAGVSRHSDQTSGPHSRNH
jgi:hypothetical protein